MDERLVQAVPVGHDCRSTLLTVWSMIAEQVHQKLVNIESIHTFYLVDKGWTV